MPRVSIPTVVAAVSVAVFLAGCSPAADFTEQGQPESSIPAEPEGSEQPTPDTPEPVNVLVECSAAERVAAENVVTGQTDALREGDFERAYGFASPGFRDSVPLDDFTGLILVSYQPLLVDATLEFGDCVIDSDKTGLALDVIVRLDNADSVGLRYVLVDSDEGWRVDGASDFQLVGTVT